MLGLSAQRVTGSRLASFGALCLVAGTLAAGCAADSGEVEVVVGSGQLVVKNTTVGAVKKLKVRLPYDTVLASGPAAELQLRGEDNLLARIQLREAATAEWEVLAPLNMAFEQHEQVHLFAPFADMIELEYAGGVQPADDGSTQLGGSAARDAGADDNDAGATALGGDAHNR
jgi:hypothetical protein